MAPRARSDVGEVGRTTAQGGRSLAADEWRRSTEIAGRLMMLPNEDAERELAELRATEERRISGAVERLVQADRECGDFLGRPFVDLSGDELGLPAPGERIGPYELLGLLGHGGMGTVYDAVRTEPFEKRVAIKVGPAGGGGVDLARRFDRERRILARLDHPRIARILDGGAWKRRPYLVMERVDGERLDRYCERRSLPLEDRLEILLEVCDAVDNAHGQLVVHRDLKPSNVLVDESGHPTVLDFGVAKLLEVDGRGSERDVTVGPGYLTPDYASPEQMRGEPVGTASDVYALGVLLYLLTTGEKPRTFPSLRPGAIEERFRAAPPPLLGRRPVDRGRRADGELDAIVACCLSVDPSDRYSSASRLADDVRRWLGRFPVRAVRTPWTGRAAKWARRERRRVLGGLAVLAVLFTLAGRQWTIRRELHREQSRAARNLGALHSILAAFDPLQGPDRDSALEAALDSLATGEAGGSSDRELGDILVDLGTFREQVGDYGGAQRLLATAAEIWRRHGDESRLGRTLTHLGRVARSQGNFGAALSSLREASDLPADAIPVSHRISVAAGLLETLRAVRDLDGAREAARDLEAALDAAPSWTPRSPALTSLGTLAFVLGHYEEAEERARAALEAAIAEAGPHVDGPLVGWRQRQLLARSLLARMGPVPEVAEILDAMARDLPSEPGASTLGVGLESDRVDFLLGEARYAEAESALRRVGCRSEWGPVWDGNCRVQLARSLIGQGRFREAGEQLKVSRAYTGTLPPDHSWRSLVLHQLGRVHFGLGEIDAARSAWEQVLELHRRSGRPDHPDAAETELALARLLEAAGDAARARALRIHALEVLRGSLDPRHPALRSAEAEAHSEAMIRS